MTRAGIRALVATFAVLALGVMAIPGVAHAVMPVVKTVPWVAINPLIPHDTWSGKPITLKGTSDVFGVSPSFVIQYTWDFGDGSPVQTGAVIGTGTPAGTQRRHYAIDATHTYTGPVGTIFTATLTVTDTSTNESASKQYYVKIEAQSLAVEVNRAIDEGLWYLHKTQNRMVVSGADVGDWLSCPFGTCNASSGNYSNTAANVNAFLSNGHSESGDASNPYTETVQRGMRRVFQLLTSTAIPASQTNPEGTFNPDANGNGHGIYVTQGTELYQGGMFIDAIVASGTPAKVTTTGQAPAGANPGILGRSYQAIVQDMIDYYAYAQYDSLVTASLSGGGWRYSVNQFPDNSANQWAAIGVIGAERNFGAVVNALVKAANREWLIYSQAANGSFGYTSTGPVWGPYAVTPSGMVQMVMNGIGRGSVGAPSWDNAETFIRDRFGNTGGAGNAIKDYYYGLFSFTKSMLLHDSNGDGVAEPITLLQSSTAGVNPIDWYAAQVSQGDPTDGVARTLVNDQNAAGYWSGHNFDSRQYPFETAWAILMLNRTVFESGQPVAVATAVPNPAVAGQTIQLSGAGSFHQDPTKSIVMWEWDLDNNGIFEVSGVSTTVGFPAVGNYPVKLRVTDNSVPVKTAETILTIVVSTPPLEPTADAGGPYNFCENRTPWFLDGTGSTNPDEGQSEPGMPPDTIIEYAWELDGNATFNDAVGTQPDVTAFFQALGIGSYLIQLRVTDNTAASFPSSGFPNLTDTDSAQVVVRSATDPACACVSDLSARAKPGKAELRWTWKAGAHHYNVYRGTTSGGPYLKIAVVNSGTGFYLDQGPLTNNVTYYWVVREAALNEDEICQSNQASATPRTR